jgi:ABC-type lipoprotein release transport system permease subunit
MAAMRLIASQIRDVSPNDALTFTMATLLVIAVSLGAAWTPARHAARIDPVRTLRME